jgi:predicted transcriptional regulator of viral defense system
MNMKYDDLTDLAGGLVCFDLPLLVQAFPDRRSAVLLQLSRWATQGKVIPLRRGVYTLADRARKIPLDPALLAQHLCRPSYLSGLWALGFHDMIPERVVLHTSVTTRLPARFDNACGGFEYRHIKPSGFFGYEQVPYGGGALLVAHPEKALLDHWHLSAGEWTSDRLAEMRYQNVKLVDQRRLREYAARFKRPRLDRAVERWLQLAATSDDGDVIL